MFDKQKVSPSGRLHVVQFRRRDPSITERVRVLACEARDLTRGGVQPLTFETVKFVERSYK